MILDWVISDMLVIPTVVILSETVPAPSRRTGTRRVTMS